MALKIKDDFANPRMVEIYQWVLSRNGMFRMRDCPGYKPDSVNTLAVKMLTDRHLIKEVGNTTPRSYRIDRIVDIEDCLAPFDSQGVTGVKRYRVPPSVAQSKGAAANLEQYAI
jgi:hypothetical protein